MKRKPLILVNLLVMLVLLTPGNIQPAMAQAESPSFDAMSPAVPGRADVADALRSSPLMFIENIGQFSDGARFQAQGGHGMIWLAEEAIWLTVFEQELRGAEEQQNGRNLSAAPGRRHTSVPHPEKGIHLKLTFPGAVPEPRLEPFDRPKTRISYFVGGDPKKWRSDVPVWGGVRYVNLYPGVDLEIANTGDGWTWRAVAENAEALSRFRLRIEGIEAMNLEDGALRLTSATFGSFSLPLLQSVSADGLPLDLAAARPTVAGLEVSSPFATSEFHLRQDTEVQSDILNLQSSGLLYGTFLGGNNNDGGYGIAVDGAGNSYVTGDTWSSDFPTTPGAFDPGYNGGTRDATLVKLNAGGTGLVYATFLGGGGDDHGYAVAIDETGIAYVTGHTTSLDFPTTAGAFQTTYRGNGDAFVVKLSASGTGLLYATFVGGSGNDCYSDRILGGCDIAVSVGGNAFVAGRTSSPDFPMTAGAFDASHNGSADAFVIKLNTSGTALDYATFLGGASDDGAYAIAVDGTGNAYTSGDTGSHDFPTTAGAFDLTYNGGARDVFVVKVTSDGTRLAYATFLGGGASDENHAIAIDGRGNAFVAGWTDSADFPTTAGAFDTTHNGGDDAFVVKLSANGAGLIYGTFLGGSSGDEGYAMAPDGMGNALVVGWTDSSDFPTTADAFSANYNGGEGDVFVAQINRDGTNLTYATFVGGSSIDGGEAIAVDRVGRAYLTGYTFSSDFPTTSGAFNVSHNGGGDVFVAKLPTTSCSSSAVPVDVMLAIDRSGSMSGQPLADEKVAANGFVDRMNLAQDQVGLASFTTTATLNHQLTHDGNAVKRAIDALSAGDLTNMTAGINTAQAELVSSRHNPVARPVLLLMSDGQPTGGDSASAALAAAQAAKNTGTRIFTIGLGSVDQNLMRQLASSPLDYYYAPTSADLISIYETIALVAMCSQIELYLPLIIGAR